MRRTLVASFLLAASFCAGGSGLSADCSFDQAHIVGQLRLLAKRVPGGVVNLKESSVSWRLDSGDVVQAGQGGCYDLGVGISITYANGRRPPTDEAVRQLLSVVSRYWSERDSREIASTLAANNFDAQVLADGEIELSAPQVPDSPFLGGFSIFLSKSEISISWRSD
jgi:hypothetical protein